MDCSSTVIVQLNFELDRFSSLDLVVLMETFLGAPSPVLVELLV